MGLRAGLDAASGDTFQLLNRVVYTPLCLLLAAAALRVAAGKEAAAPRTTPGKEAAVRAR